MGILETLIIYTLIGLVVATAMALSNPQSSPLTRLATMTSHTLLWPFFAPVLLGKPDTIPTHHHTTTTPQTPPWTDTRIRDTERALLTALSRLDGIAEEIIAPHTESVKNLTRSLAKMDQRAREMDELLQSPEFDLTRAQDTLTTLLAHTKNTPNPTTPDTRTDSIRARIRNIERLQTMRERTRTDIERAVLKMEEMSSQILLLRFADHPETDMAHLILEISATVDGLSESLFTL